VKTMIENQQQQFFIFILWVTSPFSALNAASRRPNPKKEGRFLDFRMNQNRK